MARLLAAHLQPRWGQNAVAENKSGGGGTIGTMEVVRAWPDGHTILLGNIGPQAVAYHYLGRMPESTGIFNALDTWANSGKSLKSQGNYSFLPR